MSYKLIVKYLKTNLFSTFKLINTIKSKDWGAFDAALFVVSSSMTTGSDSTTDKN